MNSVKLLVLLVAAVYPASSALTTSPCSQFGLSSSYDVIVVGTGLGGCVAARRLAEWNPQWKVLLIERGIAYSECPGCMATGTYVDNIFDPNSGGFITSTPQVGLNNNTISIKDSAVQGGATSTNSMYYVRGDAERYFNEEWPLNWNWNSMIPYFERAENYSYPPNFHKTPYTNAAFLRGSQGPLQAVQLPPIIPRTKFVDAVKAVYPNIPALYNLSLNDGYFPGIGVAVPEATAVGPTRVSAYTAYIQSYTGTNLKAITGTLTTKILFDSTATATGVQLMLTARKAASLGLGSAPLLQCIVSSNKIVVSAGALGTPKLLKLSGVGNPSELSKFGIPVVANVPGVGENLRDHNTVIGLLVPGNNKTQIYNQPNALNVYGSAYYNAADAGPGADNDFIYEYLNINPNLINLAIGGTKLLSVGSVKLASANASVDAIVNPNYFGVAADRVATALATKKSYNISALLGYVHSPDPCASFPCNTPDQYLQAYINSQLIGAGYHFGSSAAICNVTNPVSMRVKGTRGVYAVDASVLPTLPRANIQNSLYAVSERGADMINANMHSTHQLQDIEEIAGWALCLLENIF